MDDGAVEQKIRELAKIDRDARDFEVAVGLVVIMALIVTAMLLYSVFVLGYTQLLWAYSAVVSAIATAYVLIKISGIVGVVVLEVFGDG